jgi:alkylation response protein AidB-like acyl-CoA dehydrogenase
MAGRTLLEGIKAVEAAREEMRQPSFMAGLFAGEPDFDLILPYPDQAPDDRLIGAEYCARVAAFLRERVDAEQIERSGTIPREVIDGLAELGALGMVIPREYGGLGLSQTNYNRVLALVASHCNILALLLSVHQSIGVARPILSFGTEEQRQRYLPRLARGALSAFALTEPQIGSDPANMATTAVRQPDGSYLIDGEKLWCTNGPIAEVIVLTAKVEGRVTAFIVEMDTPGIELLQRCEFMGCRGIENGWVRFRGVRVPAENVLGQPGRGLRIALTLLNVGRVSVAAICLGMAKQVFPWTVEWANRREAFGKPIGRHELNTQKIARMAADIYAAEALVWLASAMEDRGGSDFRVEAAATKLYASERLWSVVDTAMQIRGGRGYEKAWSQRARGEEAWPVEQIFRDARLYLIGEGSSEILKLFIAREVWDPHLRRASGFLGASGVEKLRAGGQLARYYAGWYADRLVPRRGEARPEAALPPGPRAQLGYVRATSRRLARVGLQLMAWHREGLEERQAQVARLAEIGVDLFVVAAVAARAVGDPAGERLARQVYLDARRRVEAAFAALGSNDDRPTDALGLSVLRGDFAALLEGSIHALPSPSPTPSTPSTPSTLTAAPAPSTPSSLTAAPAPRSHPSDAEPAPGSHPSAHAAPAPSPQPGPAVPPRSITSPERVQGSPAGPGVSPDNSLPPLPPERVQGSPAGAWGVPIPSSPPLPPRRERGPGGEGSLDNTQEVRT